MTFANITIYYKSDKWKSMLRMAMLNVQNNYYRFTKEMSKVSIKLKIECM